MAAPNATEKKVNRGDRVEWAAGGRLHSGTVVAVLAAEDSDAGVEKAAVEVDGRFNAPAHPSVVSTSLLTVRKSNAEDGAQRVADGLGKAREHLMDAAKEADGLSAHGAHMKIMTAVAVVDDALTALSEGVAR